MYWSSLPFARVLKHAEGEQDMDKPVLVISGSRYGGLKQIDLLDEQGHKIIDFSMFDAVRAGFKKVVFIIKKKMKISGNT